MRNLLNTAILAASAMKRGSVGLGGATAAALDRSLIAMRSLIDSTLAEVRLDASPVDAAELIEIGPFIADVQLAAVLEASTTQCELTVMVRPDIFVRGDRHLLASAVANLLHAAVTSTKRGGEVFLTARAMGGRVIIDVEDACTGLEPEVVEKTLAQFEQRTGVGSSLGSALDSARKAVEANSGTLAARAVPGKGCLYIIDLPEAR
jgi:signal transduction histidine kinase